MDIGTRARVAVRRFTCMREYWIVDPNTRTIQVCILENGKYVVTMYADNDAVPVHVLDGCVIDTQAVFEE